MRVPHEKKSYPETL